MKSTSANDNIANLELDDLLHPASAFDRPADVVGDPDLTLNEKRAILASWASDACAEDAAPDSRCAPRKRSASYDDVMDALRGLDKRAHGLGADDARYRWRWWKTHLDRGPPRSCREGHPLN